MSEEGIQGSPAVRVDAVGMTPAEKRKREEERAAEERAKKDGPVETIVEDPESGEQMSTAEAIERVNQEEGGFLGKKPTLEEREEGDTDRPLVGEPDAPAEEPEEQIEELPDTKEKLQGLVKELIGLKTENAELRRKHAAAVSKVSRLERERNAAEAESEAYREKHGPLEA